MRFHELSVFGAWRVDTDTLEDPRGFFCRAWCAAEFAEHGLPGTISQANLSGNRQRGTLRGLHFRPATDGEYKLVRCVRGAVYDVILDLRPESPTYLRWDSVRLSADNRTAVCIPPGCAHGFLTLADGSDLFYVMSAPYRPNAESGVRWNDPVFGIDWPETPAVIADRDASYPDYVVSGSKP
jgi:dTDP-4-dehydrorhamnose 3,5-epimerase